MFYPAVTNLMSTGEGIYTFGGYHHAERISDGEFYDMKNLCSDHYPLAGPRRKRTTVLKVAKSPTEYLCGMYSDGYDSSLSKVTITYTTGEFRNEGARSYIFTYTATTDITRVEITCTWTDADGNVIKTETEKNIHSGTFAIEYAATEDTAGIRIDITANMGTPATFDPDMRNTYLSGSVYRYFDTVRGILCKDQKLTYLLAQSLYFDGAFYDLSSVFPAGDNKISDVQLISYNTQILIFPMGIYFDTMDHSFGTLAASVSYERIIHYMLCDLDGNALTATASTTAPASPSDGDYWICTKTGEEGMYMWDANASMWQPIATTYIKIDAPGASDYFSEGDAVYMNTKYADINEGSIIEKIDDNYIIVVGLIGSASDTETFDEDNPLKIERKIPALDYVTVSDNRVWGCFKGEKDGEILNEIYASKLGDPKNWYYYDGTANDSYTVSIGSDGDFTGAVTYQGHPTFFKENVMYRIYGSYPAQYQLLTNECMGVQKGSERSIAIVGSYLMYKSVTDICVYDGSTPVPVSESLGSGRYYKAAAGACLDKYYISMEDEGGETSLFVYDLKRGMWHKEDDLCITAFTYNNLGQLYGQDSMTIYGFGNASDDLSLKEGETEDEVSWEAVTGYIGMNYEIQKYSGKTVLRAKIPDRGEIIVEISVDDKEWQQLAILRGEGRPKSYEIFTHTEYCDHYRLRLRGHGDARIYSMVRHMVMDDEN